ncbi:MAG: PEP-CTERM-box response regulator transcription factor [Alphaproteobacteria bacterium]|nr:PEP-CTERM-box response regulator transcription factor [Alphaproteobacteria bacterium]
MKRSAATAAQSEERTEERVLLVEDDLGLQKQMRWALSPYVVDVAGSRVEALEKIGNSTFRVVILDLGLPPDENGASEGLKTLDEILNAAPRIKVIVASGNVERANAVKAVANGAFDFIAKPIDSEILKLVISRALRMSELEEENTQLRELSAGGNDGLVYASPKMTQIARMLDRVGPMDVSVLLTGETGTGKDVMARALHQVSRRKAQPFIAINCASIPENLLESELFGHERGAFTGAVKRTHGKFEMADQGTLFLDEIGDMPMPLQAKLLRFLQERRLERVGGRESITVDVRLITATNQKLEKLIAEGKFREDLYYRINDVLIDLPALRERETDSVLLAQYFLNKFNKALSKHVAGFTDDALGAISRHSWPGNVRELESRVKRAVIMAESKRITAQDLDLEAAVGAFRDLNMRKEVENLEKRLVAEALACTDGNISKAAKLLGISRPHLYSLIGQD